MMDVEPWVNASQHVSWACLVLCRDHSAVGIVYIVNYTVLKEICQQNMADSGQIVILAVYLYFLLSLFFLHENFLFHTLLSNIPSFQPLLGSLVKIASLKVCLSQKYFYFIMGQHFQLRKAQNGDFRIMMVFFSQESGRHLTGFS